MSLRELAKFMLDWGVWDGINLDGGGSTTMYVRGEIVNRPSDTSGERKVTNSIILLCNNFSEIAEMISLLPARLKIGKNASYEFNYSIFDKYFNPLKEKDANFYCNPALGNIDKNGKFTASSNNVSGYIFLQVDGKKDSSYVIVE